MNSKLDAQELNLKMLRVYCKRVLKLKESEMVVIANGRVLGPIAENEAFTSEDFGLLDRYSSITYLEKIESALDKTEEEEGKKYIL